MSRDLFKQNERDLLYHIGQTIIPPGDVFPPFSRDVVDRIETYLSEQNPAFAKIIRSVLWLIDKSTKARYLKSFIDLKPEKRLQWLNRWASGTIARRTAFRILGMVIKAAYYRDEGIYEQLDMEYTKPPVKDEPARWMQQVMNGDEIHEPLELEAEVVVIGSGAGGAAVAAELAEKGNAVVIVEEGDYFKRSDFTGSTFEMQSLLYRNGGQILTIGNTSIVVPVGRTVGGTTTVNSGTCMATPRRILRKWREQYGLTEFTPKMMQPYFDRVQAIYQVTPADMKYVGANGRIIARGAEKLGYNHGPLPRNAPDCDGQGVCVFGCPTGAKRSTDISYIPRALEASAALITKTRVEELLFEGKRAVGIKGRTRDTNQPVTVKARIVVLACGTFYTPLILMKHKIGNSSGRLGKDLSLHPAGGLAALVDEEVRGWKTIPQGYMVDEFKEDGLVLEGVFIPIEMSAIISPAIGPDLQSAMERFDHMSTFGFMIEDSSRGRVLPGIGDNPLVLYNINGSDLKIMVRGVEILCRIYLAAGAEVIIPPIFGWDYVSTESDLQANLKRKVRSWDIDITAYHPLGTCHMGGSRDSAVCNPVGEVYDTENLFICDGSAIPPALGVNPQITISSVATRTADYISSRLERTSEF